MINGHTLNAQEINGPVLAADPEPTEFDIRIIGEVVTADIQIGEGFEPVRYTDA
jgi:hypothetical protein